VSDVVTLARSARESLARGLNALQGDPNVPRHLVDLAAPIAQAMGALHQIERSGGAGVATNAQTAMALLQNALSRLQAQPVEQAPVATALEAVAGALGTVHTLARTGAQPPPGPQAQQGAKAGVPPAAPQAVKPAVSATAPAAAVRPPSPQAAHQPAPAAAAPPQPAAAPPPVVQRAPAPQQQVLPQNPRAGAAPSPGIDHGPVTAELGAHSPSNFYKGLSGNDIIDHGGLFVSTYKLPKIGHLVRLRVSLPGGYEFEANAVVRWRREASDAGNDAPPGFGAQFTEITSEARQLVYRYVRNREPLFHDDL